jgi:hypothetical protein
MGRMVDVVADLKNFINFYEQLKQRNDCEFLPFKLQQEVKLLIEQIPVRVIELKTLKYQLEKCFYLDKMLNDKVDNIYVSYFLSYLQEHGFIVEKSENKFETKYEIWNYLKQFDTIIIESSAHEILKFLIDCLRNQIELKNIVKKIILKYVRSKSSQSYIYVQKDFAKKINLQGMFKWVNIAYHDYVSELNYDLNS